MESLADTEQFQKVWELQKAIEHGSEGVVSEQKGQEVGLGVCHGL